jgi:hypothetical protein
MAAVCWRVGGKGKQWLPLCDSCGYSDARPSCIRQVIVDVHWVAGRSRTESVPPGVCQGVDLTEAGIRVAGGNVAQIKALRAGIASLRIHVGRSLVDAEWSAIDHALGEAR